MSEEDKQILLQEAHGNVAAGHFGENKTTGKLHELTLWENMEGDVVEFIKNVSGVQISFCRLTNVGATSKF